MPIPWELTNQQNGFPSKSTGGSLKRHVLQFRRGQELHGADHVVVEVQPLEPERERREVPALVPGGPTNRCPWKAGPKNVSDTVRTLSEITGMLL